MTRPAVEVADILRARGDCFREQNRSWLGYQQLSVLRAITACRTAALGGHLDAARVATTKPFPTTPAATGTVPSARPRRASAGWHRANKICSPSRTSTSSLPCRTR